MVPFKELLKFVFLRKTPGLTQHLVAPQTDYIFGVLLRDFAQTWLSRIKGVRSPGLHRSGRLNANVGKVKPIPGGSRAGQGGLSESLVARIAKRYGYKETQAATLNRFALQRLLALRQSVPLMGLAGVCLVENSNLLVPNEELESVCAEIRSIMGKYDLTASEPSVSVNDMETVSVKNFEFGDPIAKGCNAVVYSAKFIDGGDLATIKEEADDSIAGSPPLSTSPPRKYAEELESPASVIDPPSLTAEGSFDLAIKMMFNYEAESNAAAIYSSLARECAPVTNNLLTSTRDSYLPAHPFVVDIMFAFADRTPLLRGAKQLYPHALPPRLNQDGNGRNATMFLVMKKYDCSLRNFLNKPPDDRLNSNKLKLSLCTQLFEAIHHMVEYGVAHRDLKSDNILVKFGNTPSNVQLALTDFGCCLLPSDCMMHLKMNYVSQQTSKGGNVALMAPEVQSAKPGFSSTIDYTKADLWSAATLVYEIYGQANPFYDKLHGRSYKDEDLPELNAPPVIQELIRQCLSRQPAKRPTAEVAATILQLSLHVPTAFFESSPSPHKVIEKLCDLAVQSIFNSRSETGDNEAKSVNELLKYLLLARTKLHVIQSAVDFIRSVIEKTEDSEVSAESEVDRGTAAEATDEVLQGSRDCTAETESQRSTKEGFGA